MKNPLTSSRIEPAAFRIVVQHINHCATVVPMVKSLLFKALWWLQQFRGKLLTPKSKPSLQVQAVKSLQLYIITTNFNIYYNKVEWMELKNVVPIHANIGRGQGALTFSLNTKA